MNKDTIYRQDAIDAISCNITVTGRQNAEVVAATIGAFADRIKALPSAQPEIIRCKDCKHYKAYYCTGCLVCHLVAGRTVLRDLDDFCSRAERRTDA